MKARSTIIMTDRVLGIAAHCSSLCGRPMCHRFNNIENRCTLTKRHERGISMTVLKSFEDKRMNGNTTGLDVTA